MFGGLQRFFEGMKCAACPRGPGVFSRNRKSLIEVVVNMPTAGREAQTTSSD